MKIARRLAIPACILGVLIVSYACEACDESSAVKEGRPDAGALVVGDGSVGPGEDGGLLPDGGVKDCFDHPKTHFEIINACTNATRIAKNPALPKLLADGGLPPLN